MATVNVRIGMRVETVAKGLKGTVAYVGATQFASGKWIGVTLDEAKGKNDGAVQGREYFKCADNHGIFVRQSQINIVDDKPGSPSPPRASQLRQPASALKKEKSFGSRGSLDNVASQAKRSPPSSKLHSPKTSTVSPPSSSVPTPSSSTTSILSTPSVVKSVTSASTIPSTPSVAKSVTSAASASSDLRASPFTLKQERKSSGPIISADEFIELQRKVIDKDKQILDLEGKLDTLKAKRQEDKYKMKDLEKARMQLEQMIEYKSKWQEAQRDLQNQLAAAKKELKDVFQNKEESSDELTELQEAVEMATLDKEMAEERLETFQQENDQLKDRVEELTLDLEILKNEISEGGMEGAAANAQVKQLEQQNSRLKEAIVRMKELQVIDKQQNQSLQKQVKELQSANTAFESEKNKLMEEAQELESTLAELKDQVDTALGAEEMVETLTDNNLELEEELTTLKETVADLEALRDLSDEIEESHVQTERDLKEELDMSKNKVVEAERKMEMSQESVTDYQQTIEKFRDLVTKLQEDNRINQEKQEGSEKQMIDMPQPEIMDFKVKSAEVKSLAKSVDNDMRKFEVEQANEHIKMLNSFLPDTFLRRGGDNESILLLLLIPRMSFKCELLINQLRQKYEISECLEDISLIKGHKGDALTFATGLMYLLASLQAVLKHLQRALHKCDISLFNKLVGIYPELAIHERALDTFIDLLRKNALDENVAMEPLEKAIHYYMTMAGFHFGSDPVSCTEYLNDHLKILNVGCDEMTIDVERLKSLAKNCFEGSEFGSLIQDMELRNVEVRQLSKKIKRRIPQDSKSILSFPEKILLELVECVKQQQLLVKFSQDLVSIVSQKAAALPDNEYLLSGQLEEMSLDVTVLVFDNDDVTSKQACSETFHSVMSFLAGFAIKMQEGEYDADPVHEPKVQPPYLERSKTFKSELFDTAGVEEKLLQKDNDMLDLKKSVKHKADTRVEGANRKMEQAQEELRKKEKEFEDTMDQLQIDIDALEKEKTDMKKRLDAYSKKTLLADLARHASSSSSIAAVVAGAAAGKGSPGSPIRGLVGPGQQPVQVIIKDSPIVLAQVESLKIALKHLKNQNIRLKSQQFKETLNDLPKIFVLPKFEPRQQAQDSDEPSEDEEDNSVPTLASVSRETSSLLEKLQLMSATPKVVDISKRKPGSMPAVTRMTPSNHLIENTATLMHLKHQTEEVSSSVDIESTCTIVLTLCLIDVQLQSKVQRLMAAEYSGGQSSSSFSSFLSPTFAKVS
ncbi:hypothetical protein QZH41_009088 [Actinostola sp. cb2023]|nr:hypothetical protein QZH41_009088 [Actinostola sp. cb2023]